MGELGGQASRGELTFWVNGRRCCVGRADGGGAEPGMLLLEYLRDVERLCGAKLGCGEGGCGACTVTLSRADPASGRVSHRAVNACLTPLLAVDACAVTTVEALGSVATGLHPIQQKLASMHGSQCGFCTPGIVMSMHSLVVEVAAAPAAASAAAPAAAPAATSVCSRALLSAADIEHILDGNLCRCTGYRPILDAFKSLALADIEELARHPCANVTGAGSRTMSAGANISTKVDDADLVRYGRQDVYMCKNSRQWWIPASLERLLCIVSDCPSARVFVGFTELGIERRFKHMDVNAMILASRIPELCAIERTSAGLVIGAGVTWSTLCETIDTIVAESSETADSYKVKGLSAIREQLRWFAGRQIRNMAALGGNIVTASPISDLNPMWIAARAVFIMMSKSRGLREVAARNFFTGYREVDMLADEILLQVSVPWSRPWEYVHAFKTARRKEDDIAIVSAGISLLLREPSSLSNGWLVEDATVAFGGMAARTICAASVETRLQNSILSDSTLEQVFDVAQQELRLDNCAPGGMTEYRLSLALGFIFKALAKTADQAGRDAISRHTLQSPNTPHVVPDSWHSAVIELQRPLSHGSQQYMIESSSQKDSAKLGIHTHADVQSVGQDAPHSSAQLQCSGEAQYLDDVALSTDALHAAFVLSTAPCAKILAANYDECRAFVGVVDVITAHDVPGCNAIGQPPAFDELVFAVDRVSCVGQVIALVVATSKDIAVRAARAAKIQYEALPVVLDIADAIDVGSVATGFEERRIEEGDCDLAMQAAELIVRGEVRIGGQEHFYLETHGTIATPLDGGREMHLLVSTQAVCKTQAMVARVLGVASHRVVCKTKRIGGGFGGKETRNFFMSCAVAVAAQKLNRQVKLSLDRDVDMAISGQRHAFYARYVAGCDASGYITALDVKIYSNIGCSLDLSIPVLDRALYHLDNAYRFPNVRFVGVPCVTNTPSNTAFRGFGGPQGMMITENIMDHVACATQRRPEVVRAQHLYCADGDTTPFGMALTGCSVKQCWEQVMVSAAYEERLAEVSRFNAQHRWKKRGIAALPTKFGISFTHKTFNQAGALVMVYLDGSVLVTHGGVEMGQGLHTKIEQIAATALRIPRSLVRVAETASDKVPNASPTAASASSDMYGMAVLDACAQLNARIEPFRERMHDGGCCDALDCWQRAVQAAYFERTNLAAQGFYKTPDLDAVDLAHNMKGRPFYYFTYGAAVSEIELDVLTGEWIPLRTDIVMDVGQSLNPALDVGQIEGAFVQGMGWCTLEEVVRGNAATSSEGSEAVRSRRHAWLKSGVTFTLGPSTYKIPGFSNIPVDFRVGLLPGMRCDKPTIHSSKAVGEPPLFLGASVFFAIKDACAAARRSAASEHVGHDEPGVRGEEHFELDSPASVERIRMACVDAIVRRCCDSAFAPALTL